MLTATKGAGFEPYKARQPLAACTLLKDSSRVLFIEGDTLKLVDGNIVIPFAEGVALPRHSCELSCDNCGNIFIFGSGGVQKVTQAKATCSDAASGSFSADTAASIVDDWGDTITPAYDPEADELIFATRTALYRQRSSICSGDLDSLDAELWAGTEGWSGSRDSDAGSAARFTCITGVVAMPCIPLPANLVGAQPTAAPASASASVLRDGTHVWSASIPAASCGSDPVDAYAMPTTSLTNGGGGGGISSNGTALPTRASGGVGLGRRDASRGSRSPGSQRSSVLVLDYRPYDGVTLVRHVAPCGRVTTLGAGRAGGALRYPCLLPRGTPLYGPGGDRNGSGSSEGLGAEQVGTSCHGSDNALFCASSGCGTETSSSGWDSNGSKKGDSGDGGGDGSDGRSSVKQALDGFMLVACCTEGDQLLVLDWSGRDLELCGGPGEVLADLEELGLMDFGGQAEVVVAGMDMEWDEEDVGSNNSFEMEVDGSVEVDVDSGFKSGQELLEHDWCYAEDWHEGWFRRKVESKTTNKYDKGKYGAKFLADDAEAPVVEANLWLELSDEQQLGELELQAADTEATATVVKWTHQQHDEDTDQCAYGLG